MRSGYPSAVKSAEPAASESQAARNPEPTQVTIPKIVGYHSAGKCQGSDNIASSGRRVANLLPARAKRVSFAGPIILHARSPPQTG